MQTVDTASDTERTAQEPPSEWRPISEAPHDNEPVIVCQPGSTDHYAVVVWQEFSEDMEVKIAGWYDDTFGDLWMSDDQMAEAHSPAMWKPLGDAPPSSLCYDGATPQWVKEWQDRWREHNKP